jgi:hypothetical protein
MSDQDDAAALTRKVTALDYAGIVSRNREVFLLNYATDFRRFDVLISELQDVWLRVTRERDPKGASHVGLILPSGILVRHCMLAFQQLVSYQSFLAWLAFRPGRAGSQALRGFHRVDVGFSAQQPGQGDQSVPWKARDCHL